MTYNEKFKNTLYKALQDKKGMFSSSWGEVIESFPNVELSIEDTSRFAYRGWDTYVSVLHLTVPYNKKDIFEINAEEIVEEADRIYNKHPQYITHLEVHPELIDDDTEIIDMKEKALNETSYRAIQDACDLMKQKRYASAFDRVHTFFVGYLREILKDKNISYNDSDPLTKLFSLLCNSIDDTMNEDIAEIKTILRGMGGAIEKINEFRNKKSLAHDNENIISESNAKLTIQLIDIITDYINENIK